MVKVVNSQAAITTASVQILPARYGKRLSFAITSITAGVTATVALDEVAAVANSGVPLTQNQSFSQARDQSFPCWQGSIQVVGSAAGTVSILEMFDEDL